MIFTATFLEKKRFFLLELIFLIVIPVLLARMSPTVLFFRHLVMGLMLAYIVWLMRSLQLPIKFKPPQPFPVLWRRSILPTLLLSVIIVPLIFRFPQIMYIEEIDRQNQLFPAFFPPLFYALISVPLQEFIFRAFYIERLKRVIGNQWLVILLSAGVFGFVHAVFKNPYFPLATGILGIWWGYLYLQNNCFWPCVISHASLGGLTLALAIYLQ